MWDNPGMNDRVDPALIIADGSLAGLIACWSEGVARSEVAGDAGASAAANVVWMPDDLLPARARRQDAARRHVQMCGCSRFITGEPVSTDLSAVASTLGPHAQLPSSMRQTALLLSAAAWAMALGLRRVVWPVYWTEDGEPAMDWLADVTDRAMLAGQIASIDMPRVAGPDAGGMLRIETPYADLDTPQLIELALDMDVPLAAAWWCESESQPPMRACGQCGACQRLRAALDDVDPQFLFARDGLFAHNPASI